MPNLNSTATLKRKRKNKRQLELALFKPIVAPFLPPSAPEKIAQYTEACRNDSEDSASCPCCGNPDFVFGCHSRCSVCGYMPGCSG